MQQIDKFFGPLICSFFTLFHKKNKDISLEMLKVKDVLVIKFWGMGSIILLSPAIKMLKDKNSEVKVTLLTLARNVEIANLLQVFDEVITLKLSEKHFYVVMCEILEIINKLRKKVYDIVIDAEFFTRFSALITFFSKAKVKIGFHSWEVYRGNFYDITKPFNRYWHVTYNFFNLVLSCFKEKFELEKYNILYPKLKFNENDYVGLDNILKKYSISEKDKIICINIHTGDLALERRWPEENFVELTKKISSDYPKVKIVFIGSKNEKDYTDYVLEKIDIPNVINLSGELSLAQIAILLQRTLVFITNDSGPLHLADMLEVPTISFFGPETPVLYGPRSKNHIIFFKNIDCSPCINVHTGKIVRCMKHQPECMKNITVEEVWQKVKKFL